MASGTDEVSAIRSMAETVEPVRVDGRGGRLLKAMVWPRGQGWRDPVTSVY